MPKINYSAIITVALFFCLVSESTTIFASASETISIDENESSFVLNLGVSKLKLFLPKSNFINDLPHKLSGSIANPRYFNFRDNINGITLSGWFEPASRFKGVQEPHPASFRGKPLVYENIAFSNIGAWKTVTFDTLFEYTSVPNINAHLLREGTWIEVHLSGASKGELRDIIESLRVENK